MVQLGGAVFLAGLFVLLARTAPWRRYFALWSQAWLALAFALLALLIRYLVAPALASDMVVEDGASLRSLYFGYQFGKLLFLALLLAGTIWFTRGTLPSRFLPTAVVGGVSYALLSVVASDSPMVILLWQAPIAIGVPLLCAAMLFRLPPSRRTLGSTLSAGGFALNALLWLGYLMVIGAGTDGDSSGRSAALWLIFYSSYLDVLLQVLLGYGMVLVFMEDARREVHAAHSELELAHSQLRRTTHFDALTGALNRRAYADGVGLEAARSSVGAVIMLDLDNLKDVNDRWGHRAGDDLLKLLLGVLRGALRPSDRIYRWGGDEFLLVLPGAHVDGVCPRVEAALADAIMFAPDGSGEELHLRVSMGASQYDGGEQLAAAIERADSRMYEQKHARKRASLRLA